MDEQGAAGGMVAAGGVGPRPQRRLRRDTPLERTRILPSENQSHAAGAAAPVLSPVSIADPVLREARRRAMVFGGAYAFERWLVARRAPDVLVLLLPAFAEAVADVAGLDADAYADILGRFYGGELTGRDPDLHPFAAACEALEIAGAVLEVSPLVAEEEVQVELEVYRLTGAWGLELDDDDVIDLLNAVQRCLGAFQRATWITPATFPLR